MNLFLNSMDPQFFGLFIKLLVALVCGMVLGTERVISHKAAGMRTYALVSMGAALFVIIGDLVISKYSGGAGFDPVHIMSAIISGIGFMGAGVIFVQGTNVTGLTTASGLWVAAGIGIAAGAGLFSLSILTTLLALFVFIVLWYVEQRIKKMSGATPDIKE